MSDSTDCDDGDSGEYPGVMWYADVDGDSFGNPNSSSAVLEMHRRMS